MSSLQTLQSEIEKSLICFLEQENLIKNELLESMIYAVGGQSKRIRPLLVCLSARALNVDFKTVLPLACAIEYIHTYSLIHDDLPMMDNDDFRRNQASCHKKYNESTALLAGDTLQIFAIECITTKLKKHFDADRILTCITRLAKACGTQGMAQGQFLDMKASTDAEITLEAIQEIHSLKTGALLKASVACCCDLVAATPNHEKLIAFAAKFGILFQTVDDILDVIASKEAIGKTPNKDQKDNKPSILRVFSLDEAKSYADHLYQDCLEILESTENLDTDNFKSLCKSLISW